MRTTWLGAMVLLLSTVLAGPAAGASDPPDSRSTGAAADRYIVVLKDGADPDRAAARHAREQGTNPEKVYRHALRGYAGTMSAQAAARIARDSEVVSVERDQAVAAFAQELPTGVDRIAVPGVKDDVGSHLTIDGQDDLRVDADVAVIDTGIDDAHPDLNVVAGVDCTVKGRGPFSASCSDGLPGDGNGHGTHVAGTVAALDNGIGVVGVAPGVRLHAVKVLDDSGSGSIAGVVAGIDWVTARASTIDVANMSLGCECTSTALDDAISNSVAAGIVYAVAAGNADKDASTFSPANHPDVITVSALADFNGVAGGGATPTCRTDVDDTLADFSNFGSLVEIATPGVCILSTWTGGGYDTISGTSMASPHVAGAAALLTSQTKPTTKTGADAVRSTLVSEGNLGWTDDSGDGVQEPLLDVSDSAVFTPATTAGDGGGSTEPPVEESVSASFTYSCSKATCSFDGSSSTGESLTYAWEFGDGGTGSGATPSHTYSGAGSYTVTLTVSDGTVLDSAAQTITCTKRGKNVVCS